VAQNPNDYFGVDLLYGMPEIYESAGYAVPREVAESGPGWENQPSLYVDTPAGGDTFGPFPGTGYSPSGPVPDGGGNYGPIYSDPPRYAIPRPGVGDDGTSVAIPRDPTAPTPTTSTHVPPGALNPNVNVTVGGNSVRIPDNMTINSGVVMPPDILALRAQLASMLQGDLSSGARPYGGQLTTPASPWVAGAGNTFAAGGDGGRSFVQNANATMPSIDQFMDSQMDPGLRNALNSLMTRSTVGSDARRYAMEGGSINPAGRDAMAGLLSSGSGLSALARDGGAPDITSALEAIRLRSMGMMEDEEAQIREKFGNMGLGASSDVAGYVARGMGRGIADMNAQQGALIASIMDSAAGRRLGAGSALGGIASSLSAADATASGQRLNAGNLLGQFDSINAGTNLNAAGTYASRDAQDVATRFGAATARPALYNDLAGTWSGVNTASGQGQLGVGLADQNLATQNLAQQYADFLRMQRPGMMDDAMTLATGFAPPKPAIPGSPSTGAALGGAAIGAGGSILSTMLMLGMLSDRNAKYDIRPVEAGDILTSLAELPISTWKYKGQDVPHIGPMAQDFQKHFGVGDGRTISFIDVAGILMASQKAMAQKFVGRGKSEGAR
jgi:hypothetical protein